MSASITRSVVRKQLCAMCCKSFDIGVLYQHGRMLLRNGWTAEQVNAALSWLRRENARGAHIFIRPHGAHALSLVDDLGVDAIARMTDEGFQPVLVLETSPGNFQTWLNHGRILSDHTFSTQAAKELARRFGGDPAPTGATSVGLRASRIKSQRGGCGTDWRRSFGCIGARVGPTTPRTNSLKR